MWHPDIRDGRKWRRREEEGGKVSPTKTRNGVFALNKVENGIAEVLFVEYSLSKDISMNEVSLGGSLSINFALQICRTPSLQQAQYCGV